MKYSVNDVRLAVVEDEVLVAGSVKIHTAEFEFDSSWVGFSKTAVFKRGELEFEQPLQNDKCEIPWEILDETGFMTVGIYGVSGAKVRPTLWLKTSKYINEGTTSGEKSRAPTPDKWQQISEQLDKITPHIGEQVMLSPDAWVDDSDIKLTMNGAPFKYMRLGYTTTEDYKNATYIIGGAGVVLRNEWQTFEREITLPSDIEAFGLFFTGGADAKYIQPYDIMDVKVYKANDANKKNLLSDDIEEQSWVMNNANTKRSIEMCDGAKFVHVFRQGVNYVQLRSAKKIGVKAGTYVVECKMRLSPWLYHCIAPFYDAHSEYSLTVAPTREFADAYCDNGVYCAAFGNYSVIFACDRIPQTDILVNCMIHKLKGFQGMIFHGAGSRGKDGYTPKKGVDYFTPSDKTEIAELAASIIDTSLIGLVGEVSEWQ